MKTIHTLIALMSLLLASACYEDKGNYDYLPLHRVIVEVENNYGIKRPDAAIDYTITPKVTLSDGSTDLSEVQFLWRGNTATNQSIGDTLSTAQSVTLHIDPESEDFSYYWYLRLYVTDRQSGVTEMYPVNLTIIKPYESSWMVLHDTDNHAELGAVEYAAGEMIVTPDALTQERSEMNVEPLTGKAVSLGREQRSSIGYESWWGGLSVKTQLYVTTTKLEESGLVNQADHFLLLGPWDRIIYPVDFEGFDTGDVQVANGYQAMTFCSNGHAYQGSGYSFLVYGCHPDNNVATGGDYYIEKMFGTPTTSICYDSRQGRFLLVDTQGTGSWMGSGSHNAADAPTNNVIAIPSSPNNVADPGNISADKQIVDFVGGYWYGKNAMAAWQRYCVYAYMLSEETGKSYVYVFHNYPLTNNTDAEDNIPLTGLYTIDTPEGVTVDTPMTSSFLFNNILFYAVDNKIYKLDFAMTNGNTTLIYQDPNPQAKISCLQMAYEEFNEILFEGDDSVGKDSYGHPFGRVLGAGVNMPDGTGKLLILHLNTAGKVDVDTTYPAIQEHTEFGTIKDITFID